MEIENFIADVTLRLSKYRKDPYKNNTDAIKLRKKGKIPEWQQFVGNSENDINEMENILGVKLPSIYRSFLLSMGVRCEPLYLASVNELHELKEIINEWEDRDGAETPIPDNAVIIKIDHQGYYCLFFIAGESEFDPPIYGYMECDYEFKKVSASFSEYILSEITQIEISPSPHNRF